MAINTQEFFISRKYKERYLATLFENETVKYSALWKLAREIESLPAEYQVM